MAHQVVGYDEEDLMDVELLSEADQMVEAQLEHGSSSFRSRRSLLAGLVVGAAVVCTVGFLSVSKTSVTSDVTGITELDSGDEAWAGLLSDSAMDQYQEEQKEMKTTAATTTTTTKVIAPAPPPTTTTTTMTAAIATPTPAPPPPPPTTTTSVIAAPAPPPPAPQAPTAAPTTTTAPNTAPPLPTAPAIVIPTLPPLPTVPAIVIPTLGPLPSVSESIAAVKAAVPSGFPTAALPTAEDLQSAELKGKLERLQAALPTAKDLQSAVKAAVPSGFPTAALPTAKDLQSAAALPTAKDLQSAVQAAVPGLPAGLPAALPTVADLQTSATQAVSGALSGVTGGGSSSALELADAFKAEAAQYPSSSSKYMHFMNISKMLTVGAQALTAAGAAAAVPTVAPASTTVTDNPLSSPLAPNEQVGDGNPCPDDEEDYARVCYKKCGLLSGGSHPIRTSPFSCCTAEPCGFSNTWTHMGMCFGYNVAGDTVAATQGKCPHGPGACLKNEEEFAGMCYQKCSDSTGNAYPHRTAAATCCKTKGWRCFLPSNVKTDQSFSLGGGTGDGNSGTPSQSHMPMKALSR